MDEKGYCEHGRYVGGCGIDWICPYCEEGISAKELRAIRRWENRELRWRRIMHRISTWIITGYIGRPAWLPGRRWAILFHIRHGRYPIARRY